MGSTAEEARQFRNSRLANSSQSSQSTTIKQLQTYLKKNEEKLQASKKELYDFYKMLFSQIIPISTTGVVTIFEVIDGGIFTIILTGFAIMIRFFWFFLQSPATKIWLRLKTLKQMVITSMLALIPFIGAYTQPDLVSTVILTPMQSIKKVLSIRKEIEQYEKNKQSLKSKLKQLKINNNI